MARGGAQQNAARRRATRRRPGGRSSTSAPGSASRKRIWSTISAFMIDNAFNRVYRDNLSVIKDFVPQPGGGVSAELRAHCTSCAAFDPTLSISRRLACPARQFVVPSPPRRRALRRPHYRRPRSSTDRRAVGAGRHRDRRRPDHGGRGPARRRSGQADRATALVPVAPGFIDLQGQSEFNLLVDNRAASKITQGCDDGDHRRRYLDRAWRLTGRWQGPSGRGKEIRRGLWTGTRWRNTSAPERAKPAINPGTFARERGSATT